MVKSWVYDSWQVLKDIYREPLSGLDRGMLVLRAPWVIGARHFGSYLGAKAAERRSNQPLWSFVDGLMRKGV
jgi:hypothetical protein